MANEFIIKNGFISKGDGRVEGGLNIGSIGTGTSINNLGIDSSGNVVFGTTGDTDTNTFVIAGTFNDATNTLSLLRNDGNFVNITGVTDTFTGNTSGDCITDLYITNLHGCSPITVHDSIQSVGSSATGTTSFAFGFQTKAHGNYSHAEGNQTIASGDYSHAEGEATTASGNYSHAEGYGNLASGIASHAEGGIGFTGKGLLFQPTSATTYSARAEGRSTLASGISSHAEGSFTTASGLSSHAEGSGTIASNTNSHAEGQQTISSGTFSHSEGYETTASGNYGSHAEGRQTVASGDTSHAEGFLTVTNGNYSHAEGYRTTASGYVSHAQGRQTVASGDYSHAEGSGTTASGIWSHAEGSQTTAIGDTSHAEGYLTTALGSGSHTEGYLTTASGDTAHAEGYGTKSFGNFSHSEGFNTTALEQASHAAGLGTIAYENQQYVIGQYNNVVNANQKFIIGGGSVSLRSNLFRVDNSGEVYGAGATYNSGADYAEYFESLSGNTLPYGTVVELVGNKIKICEIADNAIGVISAKPTIVGNCENGTSDEWIGKYETDVFGNFIMENQSIEVPVGVDISGNIIYETQIVEVKKLSDNYDPSLPYINRESRPEWNKVGLLGQIPVLKNQQIPSRWVKMKDLDDNVALYLVK